MFQRRSSPDAGDRYRYSQPRLLRMTGLASASHYRLIRPFTFPSAYIWHIFKSTRSMPRHNLLKIPEAETTLWCPPSSPHPVRIPAPCRFRLTGPVPLNLGEKLSGHVPVPSWSHHNGLATGGSPCTEPSSKISPLLFARLPAI
ncbi:hypothetical protein SCLCIDRAFT_598616 [Scleroderma citrinum Foug A]|uniref:Uncharacterized protein n=1 Tax=Scleroderma citrinum Foug A TaxID=1036808 RepID=A0A0C3AIZ4_9AGAM|nr:hypothetical protein SCLCIDRAFT_598616 [Scleroderma citrinum Foug A]